MPQPKWKKEATNKVLVYLMDEGSDAWYPVEANHVSDDLYRIAGENPDPEDLHWEFTTE
jgi:hypothetical protein